MVFSAGPWLDEEEDMLDPIKPGFRPELDPIAMLNENEEEVPEPVAEEPVAPEPTAPEASEFSQDAVAATQGEQFADAQGVIEAYTQALAEREARNQLIDTGLPVEMQGGTSEALADPSGTQTFNASFEDVSRPIGQVDGPTAEGFQSPLRQEDVWGIPEEKPKSAIERLAGDITEVVTDAVSAALKTADPMPLTRDARPGEQGVEFTDIYGEGPTIDPLVAVQRQAGDIGARVGPLLAASTGLGYGIDAIRGEEFGTTGADVGRFAAESVVPTNPLEIGLEFLPGIGDARGVASAIRNLPASEAAMVASRGGLVGGALKAGDVAGDIVRRIPDAAAAVPTGAARGVDVPPALLQGDGTPRLVSPTLGEGRPALAGGAIEGDVFKAGEPIPDAARAFDGIIPGESVPDAAFRQYEGGVETAARRERVNLSDGAKKMQAVGKTPGQADDEIASLYTALHGEGAVPANLQPIYDDVKGLIAAEEALTTDFDPAFAMHPDYFPRFWEPPASSPRPKTLGAKPGFVKPRVDATFQQLVDAGYKPRTWNPYEMVALRRMAGAEYREQSKLLAKLSEAELVADVVGPLPDGWRIPDVTGAVFQPKPYKDAAGEIRFTPPKMVPNGVANVLEQMFGRKLNWGTVGNTDVHNVVSQVFNAPKRLKLMGSFFQQMDFATRTGFSTMGGAINDLMAGKPISAVQKVTKLPASIGDLVVANVSPGRRDALRRVFTSDVPVVKARPGLTWKMISEQGLGGGDVSAFNKTIRDTIAQAVPEGITGRPRRIANAINGALERGLFEGVYPQAQKTAIENFIAPALVRAHPDWSDAQIAASVATEANKMFSSLPKSQSALRHMNRNLTELSRMLIFSTNETESFLKASGSTFKGPNKEMWAEYWAGGALFLTALAETIHYATTGEPLPTERLSPLVRGEGPLGVQYNTRFLAPDAPLEGRGGTKISVDLLGQMDTALRLVDPRSFVMARLNVIPRAAINQAQGRDYFDRPLDSGTRRAGQLASDVFSPIPVQNMTGAALKRFPALEGWIADQEARLGEGTQLAQIPGFNFRAETNAMIRDRMAMQSGYPGVTKWDDLLESQQREIMGRPENKGLVGELETRGDEAALTGDAYAVYQKLVREDRAKAEQQAVKIDEQLKSGAISGADARKAWDQLIQQSAMANDARRQMPEVKSVLDSFASNRTELSPAQQAQQDYFAIFDAPGVKLEDGSLDFNRYDEELTKWQAQYPNLDKTDVSPGTFLSPEHMRQEAASKRLSEAGYWDAQDKAFTLAKKLASTPEASPEQKILTKYDSLDQFRDRMEQELRNQGVPETQIDSSRAKIENALGLTRLSQAFEDEVIKANPRLIIDLEEWYGAPQRLRKFAAEVAGVR